MDLTYATESLERQVRKNDYSTRLEVRLTGMEILQLNCYVPWQIILIHIKIWKVMYV